MDFLQRLARYISGTSLLLLLFGLYKPWMMLWWEDVQNRRKVIRLYGTIMLVSYGLYWIIFFYSDQIS